LTGKKPALALLVLGLGLPCVRSAAAQTSPEPVQAPQTLLSRGHRTRALTGGYGHSWRRGWPGFGKQRTDIEFVAFYPQLGWFLTSRLEIFGEATLHGYWTPQPSVFAGVMGLGGRYHFSNDRPWTPYVFYGLGLGWTPLDVVEIDRLFNFQIVWGAGLRQITRKGPGWMIELRNHHISNAGTRGENIGVNAATVVVGIHWVIR
jgi:hypothetical protein